jgi:putative restriction endonuclease
MNVDEQARRIWDVLIRRAPMPSPQIYYSNLANEIEYGSARLSRPLGMIQTYCEEEELAPLTILVIEKDTSLPGSGFTAWDVARIDAGLAKVRMEDWSRNNPFSYAADDATVGKWAKSILSDPSNAREILTLVKSRGIRQLIFRRAVWDAYGRCAICGLGIADCLQAAHIIPYNLATPEQRTSQKNGLLLCANHHLMFDRHQITISPDGVVLYRRSKQDTSGDEINHAATTLFTEDQRSCLATSVIDLIFRR